MDTKILNQIDPALGLISEFSKVSMGTAQKIQQMRQDVIFSDGHVSAKLKALAAALLGLNSRCEPCLKYYILKAKELGATEQEVGEMLAVASTMGGCVGEMWALKAYQAFKESGGPSETCCEHTSE